MYTPNARAASHQPQVTPAQENTVEDTSGSALKTFRELDARRARDLCQCHRCVDPSSRQKLFETGDIKTDTTIRSTRYSKHDAAWYVEFNNEISGYQDHVAVLPEVLIRETVAAQPDVIQRIIWDKKRMQEDVLKIEYRDYVHSDAALLQCLRQLRTHGLVFLRNVPEDETSVNTLVERIGPLRETFYGRTWNIKSVPDATNIANTHQYLGLHMDLLYMSNPPHLQLLHSLRARAPGGESLFSDSFHVAECVRKSAPKLFSTLCTVPVSFHYKHAEQYYQASRPVVELDLLGLEGGHAGIYPSQMEDRRGLSAMNNDPDNGLSSPLAMSHASYPVRRVNWSPPFQAPFTPFKWLNATSTGEATWTDMQEALSAFKALANADENVFEFRLEEGECVMFDNRRMLHARRAFDSQAGDRWLKGAYVDDDVYYSRLRILENRQNRD
jgi:gamma-butyrobetaine dioxygenase